MKQPPINLANKYKVSSLLKNPFAWMPFFYDLYKHEKIAEATSFLIWELAHVLNIFKKSEYLIFEETDSPAKNKNIPERLQNVDGILFLEDRVRIEKLSEGWKNIFVHVDEVNGTKIYYQSLLSDPRRLYKQNVSFPESPCFVALFIDEITCIFVSSKDTIFACTKGSVYHSNDEGNSFQESLKLSNPDSWVLPLTGVTETPFGTIIIGEYGSIWDEKRGGWLKIPYLYYTNNQGSTWKRIDFLLEKGANKHVHIIRYCKFLNKLILTDGDNKKKLWTSETIVSADLEKIKWNLFNRFHLGLGGHTSIIESDRKIIFGTDYLGGTNFILETDDFKKMRRQIIPDPYRKSLVESIIKIKTENREQIWMNLKSSILKSKSLIAYTNNAGKTWNKYIEYDGSLFSVVLCCSSNKDLTELYLTIENFQDGSIHAYKCMG